MELKEVNKYCFFCSLRVGNLVLGLVVFILLLTGFINVFRQQGLSSSNLFGYIVILVFLLNSFALAIGAFKESALIVKNVYFVYCLSLLLDIVFVILLLTNLGSGFTTNLLYGITISLFIILLKMILTVFVYFYAVQLCGNRSEESGNSLI
jgi:hypothetical protein